MKNKSNSKSTILDQSATATDSDAVLLDKLKPLIQRCLILNHEINNPLAGIIGYAEYLLAEDEPLTVSQKESLNQIMHCAERIEKEINELCEIKIKLTEDIDIENIFPDPEK